MKHNTATMVAKGIMADLEQQREYNYSPQFLRNQYQPADEQEVALINKWTSYVKDCNWYSSTVKPGIRNNLVF